jgi:multidrug efflux pump subunit AcrA (membrane-fusion protein)
MRFAPFAAALLLAGCFSGYDTTPASSPRVRRGTFVNQLVITGELESARGASVSVPPLPNWQTSIKWLAADGVDVKAGERVAELDNTSIATDLDQKKQNETQARQELEQKNAEWAADLRDKTLDVDRKQSDLEKAKLEAAVPKEIVSARDFEDRQTKLKKGLSEYDKSRETLRAQQKAVSSDRANLELKISRAHREVETSLRALDQMVLRAPQDGIVVIRDHPWEGRKLQNGDTVWVGFPIALMPEINSLQVSASLPDVDDGRIAAGMPAVVTVDGYPSMHFPATVASVAAVAQEEARLSMRRKFRVVVKLAKVDPSMMRPGLSTRVEIRRELLRGVLIAPRAAIDFSAKQPRARLASGKSVAVSIGSCNAQECVVKSGLDEGVRLRT